MPLANFVEDRLNQLILKVLRERFKLQEDFLGSKSSLLEFPKEKSFGDIATSVAFKLAPFLKCPPSDAAGELASYLSEELSKSDLKNLIEKLDSVGGFVNFHFSLEYFILFLKQIVSDEDCFSPKTPNAKKALIEFVSANPTGPLSVAHGRQAAVGDALSNILEFLGYEVTREYYLNDEGNQINILGNSIYLRLQELKGEGIDFPDNHYQGEYIVDLAKELFNKPETRDISPKDCKTYGVTRILDIIKKELDDFGVRFDSWYSQKELQSSGKIEEAISYLKEKGFIYEQEGAVWFSSMKFGDDKDRVVIKSDGSYTYLAPDIAYHRDKFKRGFEWLINLWGPDHHGYISRIKAAVEALGKEKSALDIVIVQLATLFKNGKVISMSTRKGEYVTLGEVLDEVGKDAARFFFLMRKTDSHLDFDLELAKRQSAENPVYYVQYAYARIVNILANSDVPTAEFSKPDRDLLLKEKEEIELLKVLVKFEHSLRIARVQLDPYPLTGYLQELAESFHRFYDSKRVLVEDTRIKISRLTLILGCKIVIGLGLKLLGIKAPEKM